VIIAAVVHITVLVVLTCGMAFTVNEAAIRFHSFASAGAVILAISAAAVGVILLWHLVRAFVAFARSRARIVPYFSDKNFRREQGKGASEEARQAFQSGYGIAADLALLDDVAAEVGISPLSAFGFGDDIFNQRPQWTELDEGLRTVTALITALHNHDASRRLSVSTLSDLETLRDALTRGRETQTSFSLIVRYGPDDFISGYEMEKRTGTFWC
jgi:hypothetical protein